MEWAQVLKVVKRSLAQVASNKNIVGKRRRPPRNRKTFCKCNAFSSHDKVRISVSWSQPSYGHRTIQQSNTIISCHSLHLAIIRNAKKSTLDSGTRKLSRELRKEFHAEEMNQAEKLWIRTLQKVSFAKELDFLQSQRGTFPPVYITQLGLFLDDHWINRCKGRLSNAPLSEQSKTAVLLLSKQPLTNLIIQDVHSKITHSGIKDTLTTIRERFWIARGREAAKGILRKCATCKKVEGVPYRPQPTPDLPMKRVSLDPPFAHTGLEFLS